MSSIGLHFKTEFGTEKMFVGARVEGGVVPAFFVKKK
jgi:hypothetical protein